MNVLRRRLKRLAAQLERDGQALRTRGLERPLRESLGELSSYDQHTPDLGSETFERSKDLALLDRLRMARDEVRGALERMDRGTYGRCERCGRPIEAARLLAMPWARRCLACQRWHEAKQGAPAGGRPVEERLLAPPFARADMANRREAGLDPDDVWRTLARQGNANSPQDVPGGMDYDDE